MKIKFSILLFLFISTFSFSQTKEEPEVDAKIKCNENGNLLIINGMVKNNTESVLRLHYEITVFKKSSSNNISNNKQTGRKLIRPNDASSVSKTMVNFNYGDELDVELKIYSNNKLLAIDKKHLKNEEKPSINDLSTKQQIYIDGVTAIGVVMDNTFSKLGRDFFDYFFSEYNLKFKNSPYDISIKEMPHLGRTTKIVVSFEGDTLLEFNSNPNQEYLEKYASYVIALIQREIQNRNRLGINTKTKKS